MNPAVLDAFALIICAAEGPPAYPGVLGHEPDLSTARKHADAIHRAMNEVRKLVPNFGSVSLTRAAFAHPSSRASARFRPSRRSRRSTRFLVVACTRANVPRGVTSET
jgi:hypothetical protein